MHRYIEKLHAQQPHKKREFAAHAAAGVTALIALVWISTLGLRLSAGGPQNPIAGSSAAGLMAATAQAGQLFQNQIQTMTQDESQGTYAGGYTAATSTDAPQAAPAAVIGTPDNSGSIWETNSQ